MIPYPPFSQFSECSKPANEEMRLQALQELTLLDTPESESFDRITRMAAQLFRVPISAGSLTDRHRQWFKSSIGTKGREISREGAPCAEVTRSAELLAIPDMLDDDRFANCYLAQSGIRFYAGAPLATRDGHVLGAMCVLDAKPRTISIEEANSLRDLAALVMAQIELQHDLGRIDPSSGLPNRYQLDADLADQERNCPNEPQVAVLINLADLRHLPETVSVLGGDYLDILMKSCTQAIKSALGGKAGLYQIGLASLLLLLVEGEGKNWSDVVETLRASLKAPVVCNGIPVIVDVAFGISPFVPGQAAPGGVLRTVISAANDARSTELDCAVYSPSSDEINRRRFTILTNLRSALQHADEFTLVYQPRVDLATGICASAEALLRWHNPVLGAVSPGEFIPLAEQTVLARPITQLVIKNAFSQLAQWRSAGIDTRISVNISARNLEDSDFIPSLKQALNDYAVSPAAIELEFTEGALIRHRSRVISHLEEIRSLGIELAIDDFGTGYSTFSYLQKLPATTLKLDGSFMPGLASNPRDQTLVQSIISMAHEMGYRVVAEGVETGDVYNFLKACRCDEVQGYFVSRPLAVPAFETFLRRFRDEQIATSLTRLATQGETDSFHVVAESL